MEDEIIIHRQIINHYSRPDLAPQLWNYSSTLANNNNGLYWDEQGEKEGIKERKRETLKRKWKKTDRRWRRNRGWEIYQPERWKMTERERRRHGRRKNRENQFAQQCAGIQSNNYSTRPFHCVSWEAESSTANFNSSLLSYCQHPGWQKVKWERQRRRERDGIWDRGKRLGTRDRKGQKDLHEKMSLLSCLARNWLFNKPQSL